MNLKNKEYYDFPSKVLSRAFVNPFPTDIQQLLAIYLQVSFYLCTFPYRVIRNGLTGQYSMQTNIFQRVIFIVLWSLFILHYLVRFIAKANDTNKKDAVAILLLLGLVGHLTNIFTYLATAFIQREKIADLLNFLSIDTGLERENIGTVSPIKPAIQTFDNRGNEILALTPAADSKSTLTIWGIPVCFKKLGKFLTMAFFLCGVWSMRFVDKFLKEGQIILRESELVKALDNFNPGLDNYFTNSSSAFQLPIQLFFTFTELASCFHDLCTIFIYGLEFIVILTNLLTCVHFMSSIQGSVNSAEYWKPASNNILTSFVIVRQSFRRINGIFGFLMCYTVMGEVPKITFSIYFMYTTVGSMPATDRLGTAFVFLNLATASLIMFELSKLKELLQFDNKRAWSTNNKGSLKRRIIQLELSLNKCALNAHGFFQLSLPALVSIITGILSNAMIIIQLDLSNPAT